MIEEGLPITHRFLQNIVVSQVLVRFVYTTHKLVVLFNSDRPWNFHRCSFTFCTKAIPGYQIGTLVAWVASWHYRHYTSVFPHAIIIQYLFHYPECNILFPVALLEGHPWVKPLRSAVPICLDEMCQLPGCHADEALPTTLGWSNGYHSRVHSPEMQVEEPAALPHHKRVPSRTFLLSSWYRCWSQQYIRSYLLRPITWTPTSWACSSCTVWNDISGFTLHHPFINRNLLFWLKHLFLMSSISGWSFLSGFPMKAFSSVGVTMWMKVPRSLNSW